MSCIPRSNRDVDTNYDCQRCGKVGSIREDTDSGRRKYEADVFLFDLIGDCEGGFFLVRTLVLCLGCLLVAEKALITAVFGEKDTQGLEKLDLRYKKLEEKQHADRELRDTQKQSGTLSEEDDREAELAWDARLEAMFDKADDFVSEHIRRIRMSVQ